MEPGTPQRTLKLGNVEYPLAWTKRSEALLSRHGHDVQTLAQALRHRRRAFHALCLAVHAAMPAARAPDDYLDLAEPLGQPETMLAAMDALAALLRTAYPAPAEKKSDSTT